MISEALDDAQDVDLWLYYSTDGSTQPPIPTPTAPQCNYCLNKATFLSDITIPDGHPLSPSQQFNKTWRVRNSGTANWDGFKLIFTGGDKMGGVTKDLPFVAPNGTVDITLPLQAPSTPGHYRGNWQIVNRDGVYVNGGALWVDVNVVGSSTGGSTSGHIASFTADPGSPSNASSVIFNARINWWEQYRAMRVKVDGQVIGEYTTTEARFTWHDAGQAARGDHTVELEVATQSDPNWNNPERSVIVYTLNGTPTPVNHKPNRPNPRDPYNWFVYYTGNTGRLCGQANGDPDGDAITHYQFEIFDSAENWNSGWVTGDCATTKALGPHNFQWRVKVRDSRGAESDWSEPWHFTLVSQNITINELYFQPQDSKSEIVKIRSCTEGLGGVGVAMRALVNDANDGSGNGKWHIIKELGVPCFNEIDAPEWHTLTFGDGPHRVRIEAFGNYESTAGKGAAREEVYTLPHRRPAEPTLLVPVPPAGTNNVVYLNNRQVTFRWQSAIRAQNYKLFVSTDPSPKANPNVVNQTLGSNVTEQTVTFDQDYPLLYWQVQATNDVGTTDSVVRRIGIDQQPPTCTVQTINSPVWESVFQVNWRGTDNLSGMNRFDIQVRDEAQGAWENWLTNIPATKTFDLFTGRSGHSYAFRCRAADVAGNWGSHPATADTTVLIDVTARPTTPWWDLAYAFKHNIILQNNTPNTTVPNFYPIHLHFDAGTTPTAAELYAASLASTKCDDLRIVYQETTELNRVIPTCTSDVIDIWFQTQDSFHSSAPNTTAHQLYYGNPAANTPPANVTNVLQPPKDAQTVGLWYAYPSAGNSLSDRSGNGNNCTVDTAVTWQPASKFPTSLRMPGPSNGPTINCGKAAAFNLQEFTFEMYVKRWGTADGRMSAHMERNSPLRWEMWGDTQGTIKITIWPCSGCGAESVQAHNVIPTIGRWYHVAFTLKNKAVKIYVDGAQRGSGTLNAGNITSATPYLTIGSGEDIYRPAMEVAGIRLSNQALASFPHAALAVITTEPTTAIGSRVEPPTTARADLAILGTTVYPGPDGGLLLETIIENQGDGETRNGFFTDIGVDAPPSPDSTAIERWIASPIVAGKVLTLTTVLQEPPTSGVQAAAIGAMQESTHTLYIQTDSAGVVSEVNEENNLALPVQVCFAAADSYEEDNGVEQATRLEPGSPQSHNLHRLDDQDWYSFQAEAGVTYTIETSNLARSADTYLYLYDTNGTTLIDSNDDTGETLASRVAWTATSSGTYYLLVKHWNPNVAGCGTQYDIVMNTGGDPIPTNTPLPPTNTPVATYTPTPTATAPHTRDNLAVLRSACLAMDTNFDSSVDREQCYGNGSEEDEYLVGDWDGDGDTNIALRRDACVLMNYDDDNAHDFEQCFGRGNEEDAYLVGDWNGDNRDNLALLTNGCVLMDTNFDNVHDIEQCFGRGTEEDEYLVGDWDGDGRDNLAVRQNNCILMDTNFDNLHDLEQCFGAGNTDDYLVGDWDQDGRDNLAVRRANLILFDVDFDSASDFSQLYGDSISEGYFVGDWDGHLTTEPPPTPDPAAECPPKAATAQWSWVPGGMLDVAAGSDCEVWGISDTNRVHRWNRTEWVFVESPAGRTIKQLAVGGPAHILARDTTDSLWRWTGTGWATLAGQMQRIDIGLDGEIWGYSNPGIYRWNGSSWEHKANSSWLVDLVVGDATHIWVLTSNGPTIYNFYKWNVTEGRLNDTGITGFREVTANGQWLCGTTSVGEVVCSDNPQDSSDGWTSYPAPSSQVRQVAYGIGGNLWSVETNNTTRRWLTSVIPPTPTDTPAAPTPTSTPIPITPIPSTDGELITSWETGAGTWHVGDGGVSAAAVAQYAADGTQAIKLSYSGSPTWSYFQYNFPATMDLSGYDQLQLHVVNPGPPLTVRIAVPTGGGWTWHESPAQTLPFGSKLLEVDLTANNWTSGSGTGPIADRDQAQGIVVLLDGSAAPNAIYVDNLRKIASLPTATPVPPTATPTDTHTPTFTPTSTACPTHAPIAVPGGCATITPTWTPTPAATATPVPTLIPTATSTPGGGLGPELWIPTGIPAIPGGSVDVPIYFTSNGHDIVSTAFAIDYDEQCLSLALTDQNSDGLPDGLALHVPSAFTASVILDPNGNSDEFGMALIDLTLPAATLPDGILATMAFDVTCVPPPAESIIAEVNFSNATLASFADETTTSIPGTTRNGLVHIRSVLHGDGNGDGKIDAGDIAASVLEIFDGDGSYWLDAPGGTFPGTPGTDANADTRIDAGDIACTVRLIFLGSGACTNPTAQELDTGAAAAAELALPHLTAIAGNQVQLPITLATQGTEVTAAAIQLRFDAGYLRFDATDEDGNGLPDALTLPPEIDPDTVTIQVVGDRLDISFIDIAAAPMTLQDGPLLTVTFDVLPLVGANAVETVVTFDKTTTSLGSLTGSSVPVDTTDGEVRITSLPAADQLYLPFIVSE